VVTAPDIPGHRVGGVLGAGGFATVYRCWQLAVGREVAVKVDNRVLFTERDRRRFLREVTAAGRLSGHPHVIDVYDAGTLADGRPYLVMELCPAGSLHDAVRRHGPMPAAQVRDIGIRLADALAAAHASGVLHRDIKPANILVNRFGMVGLSDFGLASIISARGEQTASREALTPAYSSPETFRGEEPTVLADVYSLAATLYALLAPAALRGRREATRPRDDHVAARPARRGRARHATGADGAAARGPVAGPGGASAERGGAAGRAHRPAPLRRGRAGRICQPGRRAPDGPAGQRESGGPAGQRESGGPAGQREFSGPRAGSERAAAARAASGAGRRAGRDHRRRRAHRRTVPAARERPAGCARRDRDRLARPGRRSGRRRCVRDPD